MRWLLATLVLLVSGCAGDAAEPSVHLGMLDNFYNREVTRVPVGTPVVFGNDGQVPHNAVAVGGEWQTREQITAGDAQSLVFDQPGVYRFFCSFHAPPDGSEGMAATLVVGDAAYDPVSGRAEPADPPPPEASGVTRNVPADHPTIQAAVDAATPGDLVLIQPGVYREEVKVDIPGITLRGADRNQVVIDAERTRPNGISITADGVAVENLTVRNALVNGVFWTGITGYRASFVTASNNEVYGIYAFDSVDGLFEHSYASGSWDAGFYIGQCDPCDAVIDGVLAERNGLGYSGTNASGNLRIIRSTWRHNVAGIVPNTLDSELLPPVERVDIVGNLIYGNGSRTAPAHASEWSSYGNGIVIAGGNDIRVERNLILDNPTHGVLVTPNLDRNFWTSSGNQVRGNVIEGSGRADLALSAPAGAGNCFEDNQAATSVPVGLQTFHRCDGPRLDALRMDPSTTLQSLGYLAEGNLGMNPDNPPSETPPPPPQPQLPGGAAAPVVPAVNVDQPLDLDAITVPARPGVDVATSKEPLLSGLPLGATSVWQLVFALYGYMLPVVLLAAWVALAVMDLARRDDLGRGATAAWVGAVLVVPFVGVLAYHALGRPRLSGWLRLTVVLGGLAAYVVILAVTAVLGQVI